jgi:hypothetical protein
MDNVWTMLRIPVKPSSNSNASRSPIPIDAEQFGSGVVAGRWVPFLVSEFDDDVKRGGGRPRSQQAGGPC